MLAPEAGDAVMLVQQALIDLGFAAPFLTDGTRFDDGRFGQATGDAVVAYKTAHEIFPNDPVVGVKTMTALDADCLDKPFTPFVDRLEWLSWGRRAALPTLGAFDFTRADELSRRNQGIDYTFDEISSWAPVTIQQALTDALAGFLDPFGSPDGQGSEPASWGCSPLDFYHGHLVVLSPPPLAVSSPLLPRLGELQSSEEKLVVKARQMGGAPFDAVFCANLDTLLRGPDGEEFLRRGTALFEAAIEIGSDDEPAALVWHTFEESNWRPPTVSSPDPRRHWQMIVSPVVPFLEHTPFRSHQEMDAATQSLCPLSFLVSKQAVVTVLPATIGFVASVLGFAGDDIKIAAAMPPP